MMRQKTSLALKLKQHKQRLTLIHSHEHGLSCLGTTKYDPTRTTSLRNQFARDMNKRFDKLCSVINKAIVDEDCFALYPRSAGFAAMADLTTPGKFAFDFPRSGEKVASFMKWLDKQVNAGLLEITEMPQFGSAVEPLWLNKYVQSAYQKGIMRARQELLSAGYEAPGIEEAGGISAIFNQPFHLDRVGLIYSRVYSELKGITASMDSQISRILAQGIADGANPRDLARLLVKTITGPFGDLAITDTVGRFIPAKRRAEVLARTEIIRAHHLATIQEYENWGVAGVSVRAEWMTAGDGRVCEDCASLQGKVYSLEEIRGMIPRHPQCRCVALPVKVGGEREVSKREAVLTRELPQAEPAFGSSPVENIEKLGKGTSGVNSSYLVVFSDASRAIFKPFRGESVRLRDGVGGPLWKREVSAYVLDQMLGFDLVPVTVPWRWTVKLGQGAGKGIGSLQKWSETAKPAFKATFTERAIVEDSWKTMKVFDFIIDNEDRHSGNWLVDKGTKKVIAIDNGAAFIDRSYVMTMLDSTMDFVRGLPSKIKAKILSITNDEIDAALGDLLEKNILESLHVRIKDVQRILKEELK